MANLERISKDENRCLIKTYPQRPRPSPPPSPSDMHKHVPKKKVMKTRFCYCILFSVSFICGYSIYVDRGTSSVTKIPSFINNSIINLPDTPGPLTTIPELSTATTMTEIKPPPNLNRNFRKYSYVRSAFRVSDIEIRVSLIRDVKNPTSLYYKYGRKSGKLRLVCQQKQCIDPYSPPCILNGYIGIIDGLTESDNDTKILLSSKINETSWEEILVRDVRINDPNTHIYQHHLGVCLQPVYLHSDYSLFVAFFEYWLSEGATKFYVYRESYSQEVAQILEFYQATSNASIEIIDWSYLPTIENVTQRDNPNVYVYRLEVMLAIMDCVYRARGETKFVAQTDLDEILHVNSGQKLITFLEMINNRYKDMASVSFRSQRVKFNNTWDEVTSPIEIDFDKFKKVEIENFVFQRPLYTKMVYRPERVKHLHIHQQYKTEFNPETRKMFRHVNLAAKDAIVLHLRRLNSTFNWHKTISSTALSNYVPTWNKAYQERLQKYDLSKYTWRDIGVQVNEEVENCRNQVQKMRTKKCHNLYVCEKRITSIRPDEWTRAKNSWIVI